MSYKLGSLFDGSGGFPLSGSLCGINPRWAAEVEPYPIAVTRERFPNMKHLGDISKINGAEIEPVDIITFGSPCQDLSVAGKRAGLKHEANGDEETTRSGLFMEAVRIIKEMRRATNGKYPRFALWENVPGAFSSNKGEDFRIVCEEIIKIVEPSAFMPEVPKNGWPYADSYVGDGWSLAYRTFDAQYWGVPQRRRRIHLVADFRGECAREVLFERDGVRGYFAQSGTQRQTTPADVEGNTGATDREGELKAVGFDLYNQTLTGDKAITLRTKADNEHQPCAVIPYTLKIRSGCEDGGKSSCNVQMEKSPTLCTTHGGEPVVAYQEGRTECYRQGGFGDYVEGEIGTLKASGGDLGGKSENLIVSDKIHPTDEDVHRFIDENNADAPHQQDLLQSPENVSRTIACGTHAAGSHLTKTVINLGNRYIVRRLTPTECARLQGFADQWGHIEQKTELTDEEYRFWLEVRNTHAAINGKKVQNYTEKQMLTWYNKLWTDSAEYKMWGNGIALPPALYCMQGIIDVLTGATEKPNKLSADLGDDLNRQNSEVVTENEEIKRDIICMATQQGGAEIRTDDKAPTLTAAAGMSGNNQPVVCYLMGEATDLSDAPEEIKAEIIENDQKLQEQEHEEETTEEPIMDTINRNPETIEETIFDAVEQLTRLANERKALATLKPNDTRFSDDVRAIEYAVSVLKAVGL